MPRSLPASPTLESLKKQAKSIRKAHQQGDPGACEALRLLVRFAGQTDAEILAAPIALQECQHALAKDYGFAGWAELKRQVLGKSVPATMLHVFWGDVLAGSLRQTNAPGDTMVWRDLGAYAPTPAHDAQLAAMHAQILVGGGYFETVEAALQARTSAEDRLAKFHEYEEVVLWFDACLYDHVILVRHLDWFSKQDMRSTTLSVICVELGLGYHEPEQLAALLDGRQPVTSEQLALGVKAWAAYRSPTPAAVEELLADDTSALPYLHAAFRDHLERFPSTKDGLGSIDRLVLTKAAQLGRVKLGRLVGECLNSGLTYLSDDLAADHAEEMATCKHPLLRVNGNASDRRKVDVEVTETGRDVLAGKADFVALNGIDRWLGGVHLLGPESQWRWDESDRRLVEFEPAPVFKAIEKGDLAEVERWAANADVEARTRINETPLIWAAAHGHLEIVRHLLEQGADIDAQYNAGNTPLIVASWHGHLAVVKLLLDQGADVHTKNVGGDDALAWAAEHGHLDIVKLLVHAGADVNSKNVRSLSPLTWACENGHLEIAAYLLDQGSTIDAQGGDFTPLVAAVSEGHIEVVGLLLSAGADASSPAANGKTPLDLAREFGHTEIAAMLTPGERT